VDYEPQSPVADAIRKKLFQNLSSKLRKAHALAVFRLRLRRGHSRASPAAARKRKNDLPITLDARYRLHTYAKAASLRLLQTKPKSRHSITPRSAKTPMNSPERAAQHSQP